MSYNYHVYYLVEYGDYEGLVRPFYRPVQTPTQIQLSPMCNMTPGWYSDKGVQQIHTALSIAHDVGPDSVVVQSVIKTNDDVAERWPAESLVI